MKLKKIIVSAVIAVLAIPSLVACDNTVDYVHDGSVKLSLDYKDKDFFTQGVGQVTLKSPIDGDTAHFTPVNTSTSSDTIKSRFWGIDTPESTGKIQPWGKPASNYTKAKLEEANANGTIVVSAPITSYQAPEFDSTGSRYVSLIWINLDTKDASYDNLYLLNLWIVQDGYSWVKNVSDMPSYSDTFYAAEQQARDQKLNLFSDGDDPLFNYGDYQDVSLLDLKREIAASIADPDHVNIYNNAKVTVTGTVSGFSNHILYLSSFFSKENGSTKDEGEYAGVNIFCGMSSIPSKYYKTNTYIQVSGVAEDDENFGFQITSANFPTLSSSKAGDAQVLISAEDNNEEYALHTFEYKTTELLAGDLDPLFCAVNLTGSLYCYNAYKSDSSTYTLYFRDGDESGSKIPYTAYFAFAYKPDDNNPSLVYDTAEAFEGKTFTLSGIYGFHKTTSGAITYQMMPRSSADMPQVGE